MTNKEVMQLIFIIKAAYPKFYQRMTEEDIKNMHEVWSMVISDYDYKTACAGVQSYIINDREGFPPSPGQIIDHIHKLTEKTENRLSEGEAWGLVRKAISNGIYGAEEEFNKLPPIVQTAVGSPDVIRTWAQGDIDSMSVIQSNFERAYRNAKERHIEESKLPENVKALIEQMTERMALTDGKV